MAMTEIKNPLMSLRGETVIITENHTLADVVRWLLTQGSKEDIKFLLEKNDAS